MATQAKPAREEPREPRRAVSWLAGPFIRRGDRNLTCPRDAQPESNAIGQFSRLEVASRVWLATRRPQYRPPATRYASLSGGKSFAGRLCLRCARFLDHGFFGLPRCDLDRRPFPPIRQGAGADRRLTLLLLSRPSLSQTTSGQSALLEKVQFQARRTMTVFGAYGEAPRRGCEYPAAEAARCAT